MENIATKKEETIREQTEELVGLLNVLLGAIDSLVERSPKSPESGTVEESPANVFDEILMRQGHCRGLIREATEKVELGISRKVL